MYAQPQPLMKRQPSQITGLDITAFVLAFFFPLIGFILGWVAVSSAHKAGRKASGLAGWAMGIGGIATVIIVVVLVAIGISAADATNHTQDYMNCVNNAVNNGTDPSTCQP